LVQRDVLYKSQVRTAQRRSL